MATTLGFVMNVLVVYVKPGGGNALAWRHVRRSVFVIFGELGYCRDLLTLSNRHEYFEKLLT